MTKPEHKDWYFRESSGAITLQACARAVPNEEMAPIFDELCKEHPEIKTHTIYTIMMYVIHGIETGDFLRAVIQNDLREAVSHADLENRRALADIAQFLCNHTPWPCSGQMQRYHEWIAAHPHWNQSKAEESHA